MTTSTVDINIYDAETYDPSTTGIVFTAYPIVEDRNGYSTTYTTGEPLMRVVLAGEFEGEDTWIQNEDQPRQTFKDPRIDAVLDAMFSILSYTVRD